MALTCPNVSHPEWKALVENVGEQKAYEEYVKNGQKIPKILGSLKEKVEGIKGAKHNQITTATKLNQAPEIASEIINKLKEQYPSVRIYKDGLINADGKWIKIPAGQDGMHTRNAFIGAVAWANDSMLETPPHEYAHDYIEMFQEHPLMRRAIQAYGMEGLAQKLGKDYVNNTLNKSEKNLIQRIWDLIKNFFGSKDVGDIISDNFYKGVKMSETVHQGNKAISYNKKNEPYKRPKGAMDSKGKFDEQSIELTAIDHNRANDYIMHMLGGYQVFKNLETKFDITANTFADIPEGEVNAERAGRVFTYMFNTLKSVDSTNGKYNNQAGLSNVQIKNALNRLWDVEYTQELLDIIEGKVDKPPLDNSTPLAQDYWLLVRTMQKLNYIGKVQDSVIADDNKMISKTAVKERVEQEINDTQARRNETLEKRIKSKKLRSWIKGVQGVVNDYLVTPYLTAKYLSGENGVFMDLFYKALDHADTVKLKILQKFDQDLALTPEQKKKLGRFSAFSDPKGNIDSYKGKIFKLQKDGSEQNIKLTDAEILSLYLTLQQNEKQSIFPNSNTPASALINEGFHLDHIDGRPGLSKTKYKFTENSIREIKEHVESNSALLQTTKNIGNALNGLYPSINKTFKQQNGYDLPKYENYFPVTTYMGAYDMKSQLKNIENFKSVRDRVGTGQPLLISDVNKVLAYHSQNASSYSAFSIPIENNRKIIRDLKQEYDGGGKEYKIINRLLNNAEGKLLQLNDPTFLSTSEGEKGFANLINKGMSNFAVAVLSWNLPVMMKQPISYLAAKELIDSKYLAKAGWGAGGIAGITPKSLLDKLKWTGVKEGSTILPLEWQMDETNPVYQEILKWSPKLVARFEGAVSKEMGEAMFEKSFGKDNITIPGLKNKDGNKYQVSRSRLMEGVKMFDAATVMSIWKAVALEAAELHPTLKEGSSEFMEHVAARTEEIVNHTQPTFDLMNRTNLSSMKNPFARTFTMFGSARSKLGALMIDGMFDLLYNPTKENKIKFAKRAFNLAVLNGLAIAFVNAFAHGFDFEDDDEDGTVIDDIAQWTTFDMINSISGTVYGFGEVSRYITSRFDDAPWRSEIENPLETVMNDGLGAVVDIIRIGKTDKRSGEYSFTIDNGLVDLLDVTTKMVGVPNKLVKYPQNSVEYFLGDD